MTPSPNPKPTPPSNYKKMFLAVSFLALLALTVFLILMLGEPNKNNGKDQNTLTKTATFGKIPKTRRVVSPVFREDRKTDQDAESKSAEKKPENTEIKPVSSVKDSNPTPNRIPVSGHASAKPSIPREILEETDPEKRAELLKKHRVQTARIKVSLLKRRHRLLSNTIEKGKNNPEIPHEKIKQWEGELEQISNRKKGWEEKLEKALKELEGESQ